MFKKIAHNSTIPALGHNQDLKPLQNLIAAEKAVLLSLQKLSVDYSKASEALRTWSLSEGDDLEGILGASSSILNHFSTALQQYAAHGHSMRDQLKAIRTKEETLDNLERRRRSVLRKVEDADKKFSKMGPENRHFSMQADILNRLREDIRAMDSDIMLEEAALGDFKRSATKVWMGLKFGGLVECCEKGMITGEYGRLAIAEITEEVTQPGLPRSFHYSHNKIENFVAEAYRGVNMVTLSTFPSAGPSQYNTSSSNAPAFYISTPIGYEDPSNNRLSDEPQLPMPTPNNESSRFSNESQSLQTSSFDDNANYKAPPLFNGSNGYSPENPSFSHSSRQLEVNEGAMDDFGANVRSVVHQPQGTAKSSFFQTLPSSQQLGVNEVTVDNSRVNVRSAPPYQQQVFEGSTNHPFSQTSAPSQQLGVNKGAEDNFSAQIRSAPPYQQQFFEGSASPSFSRTSAPSQQFGVSEGAMDNFSANVRSTNPPYQHQFSQGPVNSSLSPAIPSQQVRVNEDAGGDFGANVRSTGLPYQQQFPQEAVNSSETLSLSQQQAPVNESAVDSNVRSTGPFHHQQFSQGTGNPSSQPIRVNGDTVDNSGANVRLTGPPHEQQLSQGSVDSQALFSYQQPPVNNDPMKDFGANTHSTGPADSSNTVGGQFATFQVQKRSPGSTGGFSLQDAPSGRRTNDAPFSTHIADAHEGPKSENQLPPRATNRFNDDPQSFTKSEGMARGFHNQPTNTWGDHSDPQPLVSITTPSMQVQMDTNNRRLAGQPEFANPRSYPDPSRASTYSGSLQISDYHDAILALMSADSESEEMPTEVAVPSSVPPAASTTAALSAPNRNEEDNRHVRFGGVEDVDQEIEKRISLEKEQAANVDTYRTEGPRDSPRTGDMNSTKTKNNPPLPTKPTTLHVDSGPSQPLKFTTRRVPPKIDSWEGDEKTLNAATAREFTFELEALENNDQNPLPSQADQRLQPAPIPDVDGGRTMTASIPRFNNQVPPSRPYEDFNSYPHYPTSQPYVQATYQTTPGSPAQSFQQQQKQQAPDMRNILPPRFQAYNNVPVESQVPPRFKNPLSPIVTPLPPRFQKDYTP